MLQKRYKNLGSAIAICITCFLFQIQDFSNHIIIIDGLIIALVVVVILVYRDAVKDKKYAPTAGDSALSRFECVEKDRDEGSKRGEQGIQAVNKVLTKTINSYKIQSKR